MLKIMITKDSWLSEFKKDKNYGDGKGWKENYEEGKPALFLGFGGKDKKLVVLGFNVKEIEGKDIKKAILKLAVVYSGSAKEMVHEAKPILEDWEEDKVTWNNLNKFGPTVSSNSIKGAWNYAGGPKWYEWNVTDIVKDCLSGKAFGIAIDTPGSSGIDRQVEPHESDDSDLRPYIEVDV